MNRLYQNALRAKSILVSRDFKSVFTPDIQPLRWFVRLWLRVIGWIAGRRAWYRRIFLSEGTLVISGEHVLADLRDYCFAEKSTFDPDPHIMARREGRRDVWLRIVRYLNLDEAQVQVLMEIDDGN